MIKTKYTSLLLLLISFSLYTQDYIIEPVNIIGTNIDDLVTKGIQHIEEHGSRFEARAGSGKQAYDVNFILSDPHNRVHTLRAPVATRYLCRELLAYFKGSLDVNDGLAQAAKMWCSLADAHGNIASNYGHYVFHQSLEKYEGKTQYDWVITCLTNNKDSRKAFININQPIHKDTDSKDFPCTIGMQFFIRNNHVCCTVSSRSTDIYTGLPYDMGFFSFVSELVYQDVKERLGEEGKELKLGSVCMKTNFTQIYDATRIQALRLLEKSKPTKPYNTDMPNITNAQEVLADIYNQETSSPIMQWIHTHAELKK